MNRILLLLFVLFGMPAQSQTVEVRAGEHGSFTRLVLELPRGFDYQITRTMTGYLLSLGTMRPRYDLSQTYRMIGRERLRSIWAEPETSDLNLGIGCACHVIDAVLDNRFLILDIMEGAPPPDSPNEISAMGTRLDPLSADENIRRPRQRPSLALGNDLSYDWISVSRPEFPRSSSVLVGTFPRQEDQKSAAFRTDLLEQLARSANDGLVTMRPSPAETIAPPLRSDLSSKDGLPISVQGNMGVNPEGVACIPDDQIDVAAWAEARKAADGTHADVARALAASREGLISEFDMVNTEALLAAARSHIHFGFGAEARALMRSFGDGAVSHQTLWAMTFIVDGEQPETDVFKGQSNCDGHAALWAMLSFSNEPPKSVNFHAVIQAFVALPLHLQKHLGPGLARRLQFSGSKTGADLILSAIARLPMRDKERAALATAEIALTRDDLDEAVTALAEISSQRTSAQQIILEAELAWRAETPLSPADLIQLEAFHFSEGSGPDGPALSQALARALVLAENAHQALNVAPDAETRAEIWDHITSSGSDSTFLDLTARVAAAERDDLPQETQNQVARRLLDLELPLLAGDWVTARTDDQELLARLALLRGDAVEALNLIDSLSTEEADEIRDLASEALGQPAPERASTGEIGAGAEIPADKNANAGNDVSSLSSQETISEQRAASPSVQSELSTLAEKQSTITYPPSLAQSRDLLEQSRTTRAIINNALETLPKP